jgi:hypothetical protein
VRADPLGFAFNLPATTAGGGLTIAHRAFIMAASGEGRGR